jgi:hypothetical protein
MAATEGVLAELHTDATMVTAGQNGSLQDAMRHHGTAHVTKLHKCVGFLGATNHLSLPATAQDGKQNKMHHA